MPGSREPNLMSMYPTEDFVAWFASTFGADVPDGFQRFLDKYPRGASGDSGRIHAPCEIVANTETSGLVNKGVCVVGRANAQRTILLRVADGKVFVVDAQDYSAVYATFAGMDVCSQLLALER
jgi:hypothetical protein